MRLSKSNKIKKKYKALIVDVDGTLIENRIDASVSKRVAKAIKKASKILHVGVATARPYPMLKHIIEDLGLSGPSILTSGAQIMDISTNKIIKEHLLNINDINQIGIIAKRLNIPLKVYDDGIDIEFSENYLPKKPFSLFSLGLELALVDSYIEEASNISTIAIHKIPSWTKNKFDIDNTNVNATKQNGILEVAKILNLNTHDIIGIGDGFNDFPLLMACGLKVAMGNAVEDLKAIADYVAPSVENDGVADVIEKFIL